ncbi:tRNA(m(1)G37)methyltransferase [Coniosporium tulheliwenetii]|uniref:tRNA(M(1)G37)methyltransferase n=1 Tax=Coniosporium tulheliwenetii TaxID=3383036 RepID=A0ACC2ZM48_9PEZI|nr:tRNA(m(1)G37)methyltransferase [Cladosporium sp. JES 115]
MDKNHGIKTVINKIDNVGDESEFRTFNYEVLAGTDDLNVTVNHENCVFRFNYGKVYWNTRLDTEHRRLVELFKEGDAVCDVMAGRNKVSDYVRPFNKDGHAFIRDATHELLNTEHSVPIYAKTSKNAPSPASSKSAQPIRTVVQPKTFGHYVMNLPASAVSFLPSFIGLYSTPVSSPSTAYEKLFTPHTDRELPMIHVYTFSTKSDDNVAQGVEICERISKEIGYEITPQTPETTIWDVRDVAPAKRMFCASFRLPREVAFRNRT